jgi:uracil-DNA glycosylase family 4
VVFGEAPGAEEEEASRGFVGRSGKLLRGAIKLAKVDPGWPDDPPCTGEVAYRNAILCRPPGNAWPGKDIADECIGRHQEKFLAENRVPILMCGSHTIEALTGERLPILSTRGSILHVRGVPAVGTVHPAFLLRGGATSKGMDKLYPAMVNDIAAAVRVSDVIIPRINIVSPADLRDAWSKRWGADHSAKRPVSVDIEGWDEINIAALSWEHTTAWVTKGWNADYIEVFKQIFNVEDTMGIAHNAAFDVEKLEQYGIKVNTFIDTINLAALYDPGMPKSLEFQVLLNVWGSTAWKRLIDHKRGPDYEEGPVKAERERWRQLLEARSRMVPRNGQQWYMFYNGLDAAWGHALALSQLNSLEPKRRSYYNKIMLPLQRPLYEKGKRGLRIKQSVRLAHYDKCKAKVEAATAEVKVIGDLFSSIRKGVAFAEVIRLVALRDAEKKAGSSKFSLAKELTRARARHKSLEYAFDPQSHPQKAGLLYEYLGLPEVRKKGTKSATTDEAALESLHSRLVRGTIKPSTAAGKALREKTKCPWCSGGCDICEGKEVNHYPVIEGLLKALIEANKWSTWVNTFLQPRPGGRIRTVYAQHRTSPGRLSSGTDNSELGKVARTKTDNLQNIPKLIRDMVIPEDGNQFIGIDYKAMHWAIVMWEASQLPGSHGFHLSLLEQHQAGSFDPHRYLASFTFGVPEALVSDQQRQWAKAFTFGRMYQGSARTLGRKKNIPDSISVSVCAVHEDAFKLNEWRDWVLDACRGRTKSHRGAYTESPLGWRRYFWEPKLNTPEALASHVLAIEADITKEGLVLLTKAEHDGLQLVWDTSTHDSVVIEAQKDLVGVATDVAVGIMERKLPWFGNRSFKTEVRVGNNWKEVS